MYELKIADEGLKYIEIKNDTACANIAVQGAHLFHFVRVDEEPLLWLSETSPMKHGEHIRGGIPICWPSFGMSDPELPQHGFARNRMWDLVDIIEVDSGTTELILELNSSNKSLKFWDYKFNLRVKFTVSSHLSIELTTVNLDEKTFKLTQALHTYFNVSDISNISIAGLENKQYLDALTDEKHIQEGEIIFENEVDRIYQKVDSEITLKNEHHNIKLQNEGSSSVVVWNPWIEKAKKMKGMTNDGYKEFVCIETANAYDDYKILHSGESHTLKLTIS